jgi:hypothetical protein
MVHSQFQCLVDIVSRANALKMIGIHQRIYKTTRTFSRHMMAYRVSKSADLLCHIEGTRLVNEGHE